MADEPIVRRCTGSRLRAVAFVALVGVLGLAFQGTRGIWSPDEGYHAVIAKTMLETGDWLIPHVDLQVWFDKPPLSHWAMAAGMALLGINEWGARFSHAIWYGLTTLLVFVLGRDLWGDRTGRAAAVLYATMLLPFVAANVLTPDTPLTFWTTASMVAFWRAQKKTSSHAGGWKVALGIALALGVWTKGPAALIPTAGMLLFLALSGSLGSFFLSWGLVLGGIAFLTIGLAWYVDVGTTLPGALQYLWENHVVGRLVSESYQRNPGLAGAFQVYAPVLLVGTLPGSLVFWLTIRRNVRTLFERSFWRRLRRSPEELLMVCWIAVPSAVLAVASSKLPLYVLPVFPAVALVCARMTQRESDLCRVPLSWLGLPRRLSPVLAGWVIVLLVLKATGSMVSHNRDMRQLARALGEVVPAQTYEIVCVELRCEGLAFYLGDAVERVTTKEKAYPVFGGTESVGEELSELPNAKHNHVIVYDTIRANRVRKELEPYADVCSSTPVSLPHDRFALVCNALEKVAPSISPERHQEGLEAPG